MLNYMVVITQKLSRCFSNHFKISTSKIQVRIFFMTCHINVTPTRTLNALHATYKALNLLERELCVIILHKLPTVYLV